ncbi:MAG: PAS domain-containing protein [Marivibrio sp.]|uniref:PAS domain-containing protein n=1 Tax=Marivibrio sp. TaxID=2039719 RepID=UPI0032F080EE
MSEARRRAFREALGATGPLVRLFAYWEEKAGGAEMPPRGAIDPTEIPDVLSALYILEPIGEGAYRFRLAGTGVRELFNAEPTGRTVAEMLPEPRLRDAARRSYTTVMRDRRPWLTDTLYELESGETFRYRRLSLPLGEGGRVDRILGAFELSGDPRGRRPFHEILPQVVATLDRRELAG